MSFYFQHPRALELDRDASVVEVGDLYVALGERYDLDQLRAAVAYAIDHEPRPDLNETLEAGMARQHRMAGIVAGATRVWVHGRGLKLHETEEAAAAALGYLPAGERSYRTQYGGLVGDVGDRQLFHFQFGAYGSTHVYAWARHFETAFEVACDHLHEVAPGHFDQAPEFEDDMTYTEHGWIPSWEWHGHEVTDPAVIRAALVSEVIQRVDGGDWTEHDAEDFRAMFRSVSQASGVSK